MRRTRNTASLRAVPVRYPASSETPEKTAPLIWTEAAKKPMFLDVSRKRAILYRSRPSSLAGLERPAAYRWFCSAQRVTSADKKDTIAKIRRETDLAMQIVALSLAAVSRS